MSARECRWFGSGAGPLEVEGQMSRANKIDFAEVRASYGRWGTTVLHFCELFLGERGLAEQVATESIVRFLRGGGRAATNGVPVALLRFAFQAASQLRATNGDSPEGLRAAIVQLELLPRAVFILHGVMAVQIPWVAAILGLPAEEVTRVWAKALIEVRERLPQDFFKERSR